MGGAGGVQAGEQQPTLPPIQVGLDLIFIYILTIFFAQHIAETSMKGMSEIFRS